MNPNTRSKQVPQNIMSVEFKLFDFMTLKQFVVLCISGGLGFLFFALLGGIFKIVVPFIFIVTGIVVAFAKYNGEPFAVFVSYFIFAVLSPQRRIWRKKFTKSLSSINDIGLLLPKTDFVKRAESYNSLIKPNIIEMPQQSDTQSIIHNTTPSSTKIELPIEPISTPITSPVVEATPVDTIVTPSFIKTERPVTTPLIGSPMPVEQPIGNRAKELVVKVEDAGGTPLDSQVVLLETLLGVPIEAKVTIEGYARFFTPKRENDYFIAVAANNNLEFDRVRLTYEQILTPVVHVIKSKEFVVKPPAVEVQPPIIDQTVIVDPPIVNIEPIEPIKTSTNIDTLLEADEITSIDKNIPNTINGIVKDDEGHYLTGLIVAIKNEDKMIVRALSTNQLGQFFSHSPISAGKYIIEFEKDGYVFQTYTVDIDNKIITPRVYVGKKLEDPIINNQTSGII